MVFNLSSEKQERADSGINVAKFPEKRDDKTMEMKDRAKNVGVDLGYGFVKLVDGSEQIMIPSVVGLGRELRFRNKLGDHKLELDNLVVHFGNKIYFVGNLAIRQSDIASRSLSLDRVGETNYKILLLAALKMVSQWDGHGYYNIVTGLPTNYYDKKDELLEEIRQSYEVSFGMGNNIKRQKITIKQASVIPQPFGTLYDQVLNSSGKIVNEALSNSVVGIIDIGFKTTDFAVADNMEFIDHLSTSTTTALTNGYKYIAGYLRQQFNINKENHELDKVISEGVIKVAGKSHDITSIKRDAFESVAEKIIMDINSLWDYKDFDKILLTGGGGAELAEFLLPRFPNMVLVDRPQFANARGYQKLSNHVFNSRP